MDKPAEVFYPLAIFDLPIAEKRLLVEILRLGKAYRVYNQTDLETLAKETLTNQGYPTNVSLRYILGSGSSEQTAIHYQTDVDLSSNAVRPTSKKKTDTMHVKWVFLYNYVMSEFRNICVVRKLTEILDKINELHSMGIATGRYETDMHLFNREFMYLDTKNADVDDRYEGVYIGFRYASTGNGMLLSAIRIYRSAVNRYVFRARVLNEDYQGRETRGLVYQLGANLYMHGFLNDWDGFEYHALHSDDRDHSILFGVMATVDRLGVPHAKQCCFIGVDIIENIGTITSRGLDSQSGVKKLRESIGNFFDGETQVKLTANRPILDLRRYISPKAIIKPRNADKHPARLA
jgi:hypothetical protein